MKNFKLSDIQTLIEEALTEPDTGDAWLDARYDEQVGIIGHTNPYYRLFYLIAKTLKPDFVVELGSWRAIAASHFAVGNFDSEVITIDIHREDKVAQQHCIEAMQHYPNLTYLNGWTWDDNTVQVVRTADKPISILYVDAWHDYQYVKKEWDLYSPLLADVALVICDDITADFNFEGMIDFWNELPYEKFLDNRVHPGIPMGFLRFDRNQDNPISKKKTRKPSKD